MTIQELCERAAKMLGWEDGDPITEHGFDVIRNWFNEVGEKE